MPKAIVYLLHFDKPYKHAKHYLGTVKNGDLHARLDRHELSRGSRLMAVITEANIGFEIAKLWNCKTKNEAFQLEKRLKKHSSTRYCPICKDNDNNIKENKIQSELSKDSNKEE